MSPFLNITFFKIKSTSCYFKSPIFKILFSILIIFSLSPLPVVENLNKETFTTKELSEASYYKKIGTPSLKLKEEIEKAIKDKFNEKSDILNDFEWENIMMN